MKATGGAVAGGPVRAGSARVPVGSDVPGPLAALYALTGRRRSGHDFDGSPVAKAELDAILTTACGRTGPSECRGRRAQPSGRSGPIEVYPAAFAVAGLASGVYRYDAHAGELEPVRPSRAPAEAPGPGAAGSAALIYLTAAFPTPDAGDSRNGEPDEHRAEGAPGAPRVDAGECGEWGECRDGGDGGRMLAAEAGRVSQNLILAATALGIDARPCTAPLHRVPGLNGEAAGFVLGVLLGHAPETPGEPPGGT